MSRPDFEQALGEAFGDRVCPPVPFDDASAHECYEALSGVLGPDITPEMLAGLSDAQVEDLRRGFAAYFESDPPGAEQVRLAVGDALRRWPPGSL